MAKLNNLNISPGGVPPVFHCTQYDNNDRSFSFAIVSDDSATATTKTDAWLYAKKPDGTIHLTQEGVSFSAANGVVSITLNAQLTAAAGKAYCVISLTGDDNAVVGVAPFILEIAENPYNPDGVISTDVFQGAMQDAISEYVTKHETEIFEAAGKTVTDMESDISKRMPVTQDDPSVTDLNDLTAVGVYNYVKKGSKGNYPSGMTGSFCSLIVFKVGNTSNPYLIQYAISYGATSYFFGDFALRRCYNGTWSDWVYWHEYGYLKVYSTVVKSGSFDDLTDYAEYSCVYTSLTNAPALGSTTICAVYVTKYENSSGTRVIQTVKAHAARSISATRVMYYEVSSGTTTWSGWSYCCPENVVTPQDFGAIGDGTTDDTAAFQSAIDTGYDVRVPNNENQVYLITGTLNVTTPKQRIFCDCLNYHSYLNFVPSDITNGGVLFDVRTHPSHFYNLSMASNDKSCGIMAQTKAETMGSETDVDIDIENCYITDFAYAIVIFGRGARIVNNRLTSINNTGVTLFYNQLNNAKTSKGFTKAFTGSCGQRAIIIHGNRIHSVGTNSIMVCSGHAYGMQISDNVRDHRGGDFIRVGGENVPFTINNSGTEAAPKYSIEWTFEATDDYTGKSYTGDDPWNWVISGNVCQAMYALSKTYYSYSVINLGGNTARNCTFTGNTFNAEPDYLELSESEQFKSYTGYLPEYVLTNGSLNGCTFSGNNISGMTLGGINASLIDCAVTGNCMDYPLSEAGTRVDYFISADMTNCSVCGNALPACTYISGSEMTGCTVTDNSGVYHVENYSDFNSYVSRGVYDCVRFDMDNTPIDADKEKSERKKWLGVLSVNVAYYKNSTTMYTYIMQRLERYTPGATAYTRIYNGTSWDAWVETN